MRAHLAVWAEVALLLLLGAGAAQADGSQEGARLARRARDQGDVATLTRVARSEHGDVWVVVERLLAEDGGHEAAAALVAAAPRGVAPALARYAAWRGAHPLAPGTWALLDRIQALRAGKRFAQAAAALSGAALPEDGVAGVLCLQQRLFVSADAGQALAAGARAAREAAAMGWIRGQRASLRIAVGLARQLKRHEQVVTLGEALLRSLGEDGPRPERAALHDAVARALRALGRHAGALRHARQAAALAVGTRARRDALRFLFITDHDSADKQALRKMLLEVRRLDTTLGDERGVAATDVQLGATEALLGRWASAADRLASAVAYFDAKGTAWERRGAHVNAGLVALEMMQVRRAQAHLAAAREASEGLRLDDAPLLMLEASAAWYLRDYAAAERDFRAVASRPRVAADLRATAWIQLATVQCVAGRTAEAQRSLAAAYAAAPVPRTPDLQARLEAAASLVRLQSGDVEEAIRLAERARSTADDLMLSTLSGTIEVRLAEALARQGHWRQAQVHVERAIDRILQRSAVLPERLGAQYRAHLPEIFELAIDAALQTGDMDHFFADAERARAVALRNRLGGPGAALDVFEPELRAREHELQLAETHIADRARRALRAHQDGAFDQAMADLARLRERLDRHRERMRIHHAVAAQLIDPEVETLAATRSRLGADDALVCFAAGRQHLFAVVITRKQARAVDLGPPEELRRHLDALVFEDPGTPWKKDWKKLQGWIRGPLALPGHVKHLTLIPTGQLERIPLGALWPGCEVTLLPSATIGRLLEVRDRTPGQGVLAVGDPQWKEGARLPAAAREARHVGDVELVGTQATEAKLGEALAGRPRWRAVHFACHALIQPEHPLRSSLALAPSGEDDGFWRVAEILGAHVPADLVVLAACSSAQGKTFRQEGRVGFVHAFFVAGATRVVASLWDIDDRAAEVFMDHFYASLSDGATPAAALRDARTWMRAQPAWQHPAYWAGWQLWGP